MNKKKLQALLKRRMTRLQKLNTRMKKHEVREEELEAVQDEVDELAEEIQDINEMIEELEDEVEVIDEELSEEERAKRKKRASRSKKTKRRKRSKRDGTEEEIAEELQGDIDDLIVDVEELIDAVEELEDDVDVIEEDLDEEARAKIKKLLRRAKRAKRKKRDGYSEEELQDEIDELAELVDELIDDVDVVESDVEDIEEELDEESRGKRRGRGVSPQKRSAASSAIRTQLSTRNAKSTKKRSAEIRSAFSKFVVGQISESEARSLGIVTGNGSVTVPEEIASEIITYAQEENLLRKYGTIHPTTGNVKYPVLVKKASANVSKKERTTAIPETEIEFDEILLDPAEFDALATVTKKLIKMSGVNIEDIVVEELKKAYVRKETNYMFNGDDVGNENPGALAKKAVPYYESTPVDLEADGLSQKLYQQLVKLKGQPVTEILKKATWIVNRAAFTALEGLLDGNGRPLLYETPDGMGYRLLGHSLDFTDAANTDDPSVPVFYFGDFASFHIQDVQGAMELQKLVEKYSETNKIGFQIYNLLDGQLIYSPLEPSVYRYEVGATA